MNAVTHLEKVITGEVSAVTHLEKVIAGETSAVTYTEKVITGEATPITHLQKVIAGEASPVTHLEYVWAGGSPTPTEHEYTGAVPYTFTANGSPLISWRISGNTIQNGTPTPDSPIMPQGTGERTVNLWNEDYANISSNAIYRPLFVGDGVFTLSTNFKINAGITDIFLLSGNVSSGISSSTNGAYEGKIITAQSVDGYITIAYRANARPSSGSLPYCKTMLNSGSTALPYEPYGYKIPISCGGTTTPVYLGEVGTTRRVKKLVLTGEEAFTQTSDYLQSARFRFKANDAQRGEETYSIDTIISSHYVPAMGFAAGTIVQSNDTDINLTFNMQSSTYPDLTAFTNWLAQQYATGTPVTVWYVLATPQTAVVNEPLMKIGTYADEVSNAATIPTVNGSNTFDVDTTVKPSEVYIKNKGV